MKNILKKLNPIYWFNRLKMSWLKSVTEKEVEELIKEFKIGESKFIKEGFDNLFVDNEGKCHLEEYYYCQSSTFPSIDYLYTVNSTYETVDDYIETKSVEEQIKFLTFQKDACVAIEDYENADKYNQKIQLLKNGAI